MSRERHVSITDIVHLAISIIFVKDLKIVIVLLSFKLEESIFSFSFLEFIDL